MTRYRIVSQLKGNVVKLDDRNNTAQNIVHRYWIEIRRNWPWSWKKRYETRPFCNADGTTTLIPFKSYEDAESFLYMQYGWGHEVVRVGNEYHIDYYSEPLYPG